MQSEIARGASAYWFAMCGLLGLLTSSGDAATRADAVGQAMRCARHRGPDESGTWHDSDVVFGFNRLSIIDVEHSHQPLRWGPSGADDRYAIVFNGEVYNYLELRAELAELGATFATEGDTEAVVAAYHHWGPAAVSRLRGMFAFTIWDTHERVLFAARDPFGIKPLFVAEGPGGIAFASEKKSLLELAPTLGLGHVDRDLDAAALQHYLLLQYVPEPATLHRAIRRVESGTHVTVRPGGEPEAERYFTPVLHAGGGQDAPRRIEAVLRDSVAKHMRADVTVGAFLSGGIDSTAIAALAKEHNPDLITFTTGFDREGYSEVDVAAESAAAIGVRHVIRTVKPDEMMDALPLIVWYLDDPVADPALVPLWFIAREARRHVKVVLSGEGADELFGGYTIYREPLSLAPFEKVPGALRGLLGRASTRLPDGMRGKDLLRRGAIPLEQRYYGNARIFRDGELAGVLRQYDPRRSHTDVTAAPLRGVGGLGPGGAHAARRPVHLAAGRHPRQGRQDDDGELPRAAGAVPGPRGVRRGVRPAARGEAGREHDEARPAQGARGHRPAARAAAAQAGLPRAHPALAARRDVRLGARHRARQPGRPPGRPGRRHPHARRPPRRPDRPQPPHLDAAGVPALARDLRGAAHHPGDPRARLPGDALALL